MDRAERDPQPIGRDVVPRKPEAVAAVELDGEAVVYHEEHDSVHTLNATATIVWQWLDGATPLGQVINELAAAFDAAPTAIERDVVELVGELARQGLLEGLPATDRPADPVEADSPRTANDRPRRTETP